MLCVNRVNLLRHHYFVLISNKQLLYQVSKSFFILTRGMRLSALSASLRPKTGFSEFVKSSKLSNTAYYWETYSHLKNLTTFNSKSYIPQPSPPPLINLIIIWILVTLRTQSVRPHSQECYSQCLDLTAFSPCPIPPSNLNNIFNTFLSLSLLERPQNSLLWSVLNLQPGSCFFGFKFKFWHVWE